MALIKCAECKKKISDKASACPHCGCPVEVASPQNESDAKNPILDESGSLKAPEVNLTVDSAEPISEEAEIQTKKKKKNLAIWAVCAVVLIAVGILAWHFGYVIPQRSALTLYESAIASYNVAVEKHNLAVGSYNDAAKEIIAANDAITLIIDEAQAVIDSGEIPYEAVKMTTLSNTLKDTRNNIVSIPALYENESTLLSNEEYYSQGAKAIEAEAARINGLIDTIDELSSDICAAGESLIIPDYSTFENNIASQKKELEDSYATQRQLTNPNQEFIIERLGKVANVANIACASEENDPNGNLGKPGSYRAQIFFSSPLLNTETTAGDRLINKGTEAGGSIEVYETIELAERRNEYLAAFDGTIFDSGSHIVLGTMIIRTSYELPFSKQEAFTNEIIAALIAP